MSYSPRLKDKYRNEIVSALMEKFQYSTVMQVPKIVKVCLNQGVGMASQDKKLVDNALTEMTMIAGQKAVPTKARKSIPSLNLKFEIGRAHV